MRDGLLMKEMNRWSDRRRQEMEEEAKEGR